MDQDQPKSVWLKLILPICLGVFATAIYHNAIKTQSTQISGFEVTKTMKSGQPIEVKVLIEALQEKRITFHSQSPESLKSSFAATNITNAVKGWPKLIVNRPLLKGEFVSTHDFRKSE